MKTKIEAITKILNQVADRMPAAITATQGDKREGPARILFAEHAPALAALAERHGLKLPGPTPAEMLAAIEEANELAPLSRRLSILLQRVEDQLLHTRSDAWKKFTQLYSVISHLAQNDATLAEQLEPVTQFFSNSQRN